MNIKSMLLICLIFTATLFPTLAFEGTTEFAYQGQLKELGQPSMGLYDFEFSLYDAEIDGVQIGGTISINDVVVSSGLFSVMLDFGDAFTSGQSLWLEISVKPRDSEIYNTLRPRQLINSSPIALYAKKAGNTEGTLKGPGTTDTIAKYVDPNTLGDSIISENTEKITIAGDLEVTGGFLDSLANAGLLGQALFSTGAGTEWMALPPDIQLSEAEVDAMVANNGYLTNEIDPSVLASVKDGVSWSEILGIPADFADGVDNVGTFAETDPTVDPNIKDGISWSEVSGRPSGLDDGDDVGLTAETDPTVDPDVKDGVSWDEISGIPSGFADGIDDVGSGSSGQWISVSLSNEATKTINGLSAGKFYEFLITVTQNTSPGYIRMRINEDAGNNYWRSTTTFDSSGPGGDYKGETTYWPLSPDEDLLIQVVPDGNFGASLSLMPAGATNNTTLITGTFTLGTDFSIANNHFVTTISGRHEGSSGISSATLFTSAGTLTGKILYRQIGP